MLAKSPCGLRGNRGVSSSHSPALAGVEQTRHRLNVTFGWSLHPPSSGSQLLGQRKETLRAVFLWEKVAGAAWPKWDTKVGRAVLGKARQGLFQVRHALRSTPRAVPLNHTWTQTVSPEGSHRKSHMSAQEPRLLCNSPPWPFLVEPDLSAGTTPHRTSQYPPPQPLEVALQPCCSSLSDFPLHGSTPACLHPGNVTLVTPDPLSQATQRDARAEDRMGEKEREEVGRSPSGASREPRKGVLPEGAVCGSKCRQMESGANGN